MATKKLSPKTTIDQTEEKIKQVAQLILECDAIIFTSGAGMSVPSGLGTFRGNIVNPDWFNKSQGNSVKHDTVNFAYAFWVDQYRQYSSTLPHQGYSIAKQWSQLHHIKYSFSYTSNIDGHWRKSDWNDSSLFECHGSIDQMQCIYNCCDRTWPTNDQLQLHIDCRTNCVDDHLPVCPHCQQLSRPNVLMFNDWHFAGQIYNEKMSLYEQFKSHLSKIKAKLLIIEIGAGTTIPSIRNESESLFKDKRWISHFVRINHYEEHSKLDQSNDKFIQLTLDSLTALTRINQCLQKQNS